MNQVTVQDLMTDEVISVKSSEDLSTAYDLMESQGIRHLPVVDSEGVLIAVLSQRDLLRCGLFAEESLTSETLREFLRQRRVNEIMVRDPETITADQEIEEAADKLLENKFGCLPVVEGRHLTGILTEADFVRYVRDRARSLKSEALAS